MIPKERRVQSTTWPFGGRYPEAEAWLNTGRGKLGSLWDLIIEQHELHPKKLKALGGYGEYSNAIDIDPLVWMKPDVMTRFMGKPKGLIAVMAPSAGGKDTILRQIKSTHPDLIDIVVTHTTKPPRTEDREGETYYFVDNTVFDTMVNEDKFAEHVPQFGRRYGTSRQAIQESIDAPQPITVWRGEPIGWNRLQYELKRIHPDVPYASCFILPEISATTLALWILNKRGAESPIARIEKAVMEVYAGGAMEICIVNPYQPDEGPTQATNALISVFTAIQRMQRTNYVSTPG